MSDTETELREAAKAAIQATRTKNAVPIFRREQVDAVVGAIRPFLEKRDEEIAELKADIKAIAKDHVKFHSVKVGIFTVGFYTTDQSAGLIQDALAAAQKDSGRLDEMYNRLMLAHVSISNALELPAGWVDIREAIDASTEKA